MNVRIKLLDHRAIIPTQRAGDAGADLYAMSDVYINSSPTRIGFGLAVEIPDGYAGFVVGRSGLSSAGRCCVTGTIDSGYRGEVSAILYDKGNSWRIRAGDRVAQLVIVACPRVTYDPCDQLSSTSRGNGGFGSTGIHGPYREPGNGG